MYSVPCDLFPIRGCVEPTVEGRPEAAVEEMLRAPVRGATRAARAKADRPNTILRDDATAALMSSYTKAKAYCR